MKRAFLALAALILATAGGARAETLIAAGSQPQLAADETGAVWVAFGRGKEVLVARSDDGGRTFAPAVQVAALPSLMLGRRRGPRIVAHGGRVTVTAMAGDLHAFRSTDGGRTWTGPFRVNDQARSAREGLNALSVAPDGRVLAAWLDLRGERTQLYGSESSDGGATWSGNRLIYRAPAGETICECCHPSLAFGPGGELIALWRNALGGARAQVLLKFAGAGEEHAALALPRGDETILLRRHRTSVHRACPEHPRARAELGGRTEFGRVR